MRRSALALPLALATTVALAACAGAPGTGSTADPEGTTAPAASICDTPSGSAVESVTVSGGFGERPDVEFSAPIEIDEPQRLVLIEGESAAEGAQVSIAYAIYDGLTGEEIEVGGWDSDLPPIAVRADPAVTFDGFARTLACLGAGSRAVGVFPGNGDAAEPIVFVADVLEDLAPAEWTTDVPEIGGTDEAPTVTLTSATPKPDLELAVLAEGDGPVVGAADSVTVHYLGTAWETGEVFDQSYSRGEPATFSVQGVVDGFSAALIGQRVGSRVIVTMPPALGYGEAGTSDHALAGMTLVFLIDIVDTQG